MKADDYIVLDKCCDYSVREVYFELIGKSVKLRRLELFVIELYLRAAARHMGSQCYHSSLLNYFTTLQQIDNAKVTLASQLLHPAYNQRSYNF